MQRGDGLVFDGLHGHRLNLLVPIRFEESFRVGGVSLVHLQDRGAGVATSMFGTYIRQGELIVYPFFEGYVDDNLEYKPEEFGYPGDVDFRGRYRASEGLLIWANMPSNT